jgi:penicillin-binding protein 1A
LVALNPKDGAIRSLAGGFDFRQSHFNRAAQAARQPGSSFKPFIYAAALENGFTPASMVNDAPVVVEDASLEGAWRPENDGGSFLGPTRLREALYRSRNLVSIRIMRSVGINTMLNSLERFGMNGSELPRNLSLALGSFALTPMQMAAGYAVFANGGYQVQPYIVARVERDNDEVVYQALPLTVCKNCPDQEVVAANAPTNDLAATARANLDLDPFALDLELTLETAPEASDDSPTSLATLSELAELQIDAEEPLPVAPRVMEKRVAYVIDSMLRDVIAQPRGTGGRARVLQRGDLAGKTGTTNGPRDAWFAGYSPDVVAVAWMGFDQNTSLGRGHYGGTAALPIWIEFMRTALEGVPEKPAQQPDGIVTVRINPDTGMRARAGDPDAIFEIFLSEDVPPFNGDASSAGSHSTEDTLPEELF